MPLRLSNYRSSCCGLLSSSPVLKSSMCVYMQASHSGFCEDERAAIARIFENLERVETSSWIMR